ncbi:MAG: hypothetical protein HW412_2095 [Bacteroidetes bacterium]|nr:hypothetical protein [Bacteroidota bacterium]
MNKTRWILILTSLLIGCSTYNNYYLVTPSVHDAVLGDLRDLAARAQRYYYTPVALGGGQGLFLGVYTISQLTLYPTNANGSYRVVKASPTELVLEGTCIERGGERPFTVQMKVRGYEAEVISDRRVSVSDITNTRVQPETLIINYKLADEELFNNCNGLISDLLYFADLAHEYYRRPRRLCGGGGSFRNLAHISKLTPSPTTMYGTYYFETATESLLVIRGTGVTLDRTGHILRIGMQVTGDGMFVVRDTANPIIAYEEPMWSRYNREVDRLLRSQHDALLNDLVNLASGAQQYYRRPNMLGGGSGSFGTLKTIEAIAGSTRREAGTFSLAEAKDQSIILEGVGREKLWEGYPLVIRMLVTAGRDSVIYDSMLPCY